jgi:hypothetical protein
MGADPGYNAMPWLLKVKTAALLHQGGGLD